MEQEGIKLKKYLVILAAISFSLFFLAIIFLWASVQYGSGMYFLSGWCSIAGAILLVLGGFLNWLYPDEDFDGDSEDG